jgi:hypothetical protein
MTTRGVNGFQVNGNIIAYPLKIVTPLNDLVHVLNEDDGWEEFKKHAARVQPVHGEDIINWKMVEHHMDNFPYMEFGNKNNTILKTMREWWFAAMFDLRKKKKESNDPWTWNELFQTTSNELGGWFNGLVLKGVYDGTVRHVIHDEEFFKKDDSCEQAHILNLDDMTYDYYYLDENDTRVKESYQFDAVPDFKR